jgi:hypothetical protein
LYASRNAAGLARVLNLKKASWDSLGAELMGEGGGGACTTRRLQTDVSMSQHTLEENGPSNRPSSSRPRRAGEEDLTLDALEPGGSSNESLGVTHDYYQTKASQALIPQQRGTRGSIQGGVPQWLWNPAGRGEGERIEPQGPENQAPGAHWLPLFD